MTSSLSKIALVSLLVSSAAAVAQEIEPLPTLVTSKNVTTPVASVSVEATASRCDQNGNIYGRFALSGVSGPLGVTQISGDGKHVTSFDLTSMPNRPEKSSIGRFTVAPDGTVYLLGKAFHQAFLIQFRPDGTYVRKIALDRLGIENFGVFKNGDFLITGIVPGTPESPAAVKPFNALYNSDGVFLREVEFATDADLEKAAKTGDSEFSNMGTGNRAVSLGSAYSGDDGNVYIVRRTSPPTVYVISPAGTVRKHYQVGEPGDWSFGFQVAKGTAAMLLGKNSESDKSRQLVLLNATSGREIRRYSVPQSFWLGLACYDGTDTVWFGMDRSGKLQLVHAELK